MSSEPPVVETCEQALSLANIEVETCEHAYFPDWSCDSHLDRIVLPDKQLSATLEGRTVGYVVTRCFHASLLD